MKKKITWNDLDPNEIVTKSYLDKRLKEHTRHMDIRFENILDAIKVLNENVQMRSEKYDAWLSDHEDRIQSVELKVA